MGIGKPESGRSLPVTRTARLETLATVEVGINVAAGSDAIRIEVRDSGEGVTRRQLTRVFEPFVQFGRSTGDAGLGLTLSREIVERHGGRIEIASQRGQGARFIVNLPWPGV